jgi:plasmid stabilization system protein ParE
MAYRVELTARAHRDLRRLFQTIGAAGSAQAKLWFDGLEAAVLSLERYPARGAITPESSDLRHLLYGGSRYVYRIIYSIDEIHRSVTVLHIRHGLRKPMK